MSGRKWYTVNVYPATKRGDFSVVVLENTGYHWHCEKHEHTRCRDCSWRRRSRMVTSYRAEAPEAQDLASLIDLAVSLVHADLQDGPSPPRQYLRPWSIRPEA